MNEEATVEDVESEFEPVQPKNGGLQESSSWNYYDIFQTNPWLLLILAYLAYYVYQNYVSKIRLPSNDAPITAGDEQKVRDMMEIRDRQQKLYDAAAKELEEKRK